MNNVIANLGENYEYLRVIVNNQFELKKLDLMEDSAKIISMSALAIILSILLSSILICTSIIAIILLKLAFHSTIYALLAFMGILSTIGVIIFTFRKELIITPITNAFYGIIEDRI